MGLREEKLDDAGREIVHEGRWTWAAQTDRCQMRGHGVRGGDDDGWRMDNPENCFLADGVL